MRRLKRELEVTRQDRDILYDNAAMESFFSTLKGECVDRQMFETRQEVRLVIFEYIECFYNRERRHSTLYYLSPVAYKQQRS